MRPTKLKMLIVEDDKLIGRLIKDFFKHHDYEFLAAEDGEEALRLCLEQKPDVIITDLMIPKMNGVQLIETLRSMPEFAVIPIIACTAGGTDLQEQARTAGAHLVVTKPINAEELIKRVDELLMASPYLGDRAY